MCEIHLTKLSCVAQQVGIVHFYTVTEIKGLSCRLWWMREWRNLLTSTHVGYWSVIRAVAGGASLKFGVQGASATNWFSRVNGARDNGIRLYHFVIIFQTKLVKPCFQACLAELLVTLLQIAEPLATLYELSPNKQYLQGKHQGSKLPANVSEGSLWCRTLYILQGKNQINMKQIFLQSTVQICMFGDAVQWPKPIYTIVVAFW